MVATVYRNVQVDGLKLFYREVGSPEAPVLLLLHGFPTSSHMFRNLIPRLADRFNVIAPDLPGFGFSEAPDRARFTCRFEHLAQVIGRFTEILSLARYSIYVFDYGAPIGFRLALERPERISAIVSQNGNAYLEGLSDGWNPIQAYWREPTGPNRAALRAFIEPATTRWQYVHGLPDESVVAPESYTLDSALLAQPGNDEIQLESVWRLPEQCRAVPQVPGIPPHSHTVDPGGMGQKRSVFPARRRGSVQTRQSRRRGSPARRRPFRPGNQGTGNRRDHPRVPRA